MMTSLYRHFDRDGRLLYVGISKNAIARLGDHKRKASWYPDIRNVSIASYPNRDAALRAEARAIRTENPIHNAMRPAPKPVPDRLSAIIERCAARQLDEPQTPRQGPERPRVLGYISGSVDDAEPIISRMMKMGVCRELLFIDTAQEQVDAPPGLTGLMKAAQHEGSNVLTFPSIPDDCRDLLRERGVKIRAVA